MEEKQNEEPEKENIEPSSETEEEKKKTKQSGKYIVLSIIAICAIFFSIFAITSLRNNLAPQTIDDLHENNINGKETDRNYLYNGYSFVNLDNMWYFQVQSQGYLYDVPLRYGPKELEEVSIDVDLSLIDANKYPEIYMTIDPRTTDATYQTLAVSELALNLVRAMNIIPRAACVIEDNESCAGRDIVDCSYENAPIIYIKESNETKIYQNSTCYVIEGKGEELLKSVDRFIYKIYNVMQ